MKFTFLGTGTSAGIPMIGCSCEVCTSSDPRDQRLRTAACLRFTDERGIDRIVLLDAGPDLRVQAIREGLNRCDAIFFTHNHVDHVFGLDEVRRFNAVQRSAIEIYADDHTMDSLERIYKHIFEKDRNVNSSFVATLLPFRIHAAQIEAASPTRLFGVNFIPVPLLHGRLPILGWRIEPDESLLTPEAREIFPLAYCTDVSAVPPGSWSLLQGVKTLVLDALRHRAHPTHLTVDQALSIAEHVGAQQTYFVHMAHDLPHQTTQDQLPPGRFLAHDGLTLPVRVV
ncbi:MAG: MBL fold metallo-hydrolase [Planctomycetota bacterium]|nr:MBL fold metallo-hydrolase [Planctomycetota bacterium]